MTPARFHAVFYLTNDDGAVAKATYSFGGLASPTPDVVEAAAQVALASAPASMGMRLMRENELVNELYQQKYGRVRMADSDDDDFGDES